MGNRSISILETSLYADDLSAARTFYENILGLKLHSELEGRHIFFYCGKGMLLIFNPTSSETTTSVPAHGATGAGHICFSVQDEKELSGWKEHLVEHGIAIEQEETWGDKGKSFYFRDPAGNSIEFAMRAIWGL